MSKLQLFAIRDRVVGSYHRPFTAANEFEAQRMVLSVMQNDDNQLHHHPDDFSLYHLGEYDQITGVINAFVEPTLVVPLGVLKKYGINGNNDGDSSDEQA